MSPDLINAAFEFFAAIAVSLHCAAIWRDKEVKGVSVPGTCLFLAWGFWNLYYYPHLDQPLSFACGLFVTAANLVYVALLMYYGECMWPWRLYAFLIDLKAAAEPWLIKMRRRVQRRIGAVVCWLKGEHDWPGVVFQIKPYALCHCSRCGEEVAGRTFDDIRPMTDEEWEFEQRFDHVYEAQGARS